MAMPLDLPDEIAQRVQHAAIARGISAEQVVIEAVEAQLGLADESGAQNPLSALADELRRMAFDGSLRRDIDAVVDDPELAVG